MINWLKTIFTKKPKVKWLSVQDLHASLTLSPPMIVDVRSKEEFAFHGHIPGSVLIPLPELSRRLAEIPADRTILCVDRMGRRSEQACVLLMTQGYDTVFSLDGGIQAWKKAGFALQRVPLSGYSR